MRRANGSGSVYKLSGKRHKPWCAKAVTSWKDNGQPIYQYIGYFKTKSEAQDALALYRAAPEKAKHITVAKAWERWLSDTSIKKSSIDSYRSAYKRLAPIYDTDLDKLNLTTMQALCDHKPVTYAKAAVTKKVLSALLEWGFAHDYCSSSRKALLDYIRLPERPGPQETRNRPWEPWEIERAFDKHWIGTIILLFTGLRFSELLSLKTEDIHLDQMYLEVRDAKTRAGIRKVPIPEGLRPYWEEYIQAGFIGRSRTYWNNRLWSKEMNHRHHDCRHTYSSMLAQAEVDARVVKKIMGHKGDVTIDVYTHYDMDYLRDTVNKAFARWFPVPLETDDQGQPVMQA